VQALWLGLKKAPLPLDLCRVEGPDPLAALQKVVSADLRGLQEGEIRRSLLLHPKGQGRALFAVARLEGTIFLLAPPQRGASLAALLQTYLRFSRCQVEVVEASRHWLLGWREEKDPAFADLLPPLGSCRAQEGMKLFGESLCGLPGWLLVGELPAGVPPVAPETLEAARIYAGFPAWGQELVEDVLPQEVGLGQGWVSLEKGCYVGQETMARLATYGHVNRKLVRLRSSGSEPLPPSPPLELAEEGSPKPVGRLTSWAREAHGLVALGLVHKKVAAEGRHLLAAERVWVVEAVLA